MENPGQTPLQKFSQVFSGRDAVRYWRSPLVLLSLATILALFLFLNKAFHIDDPLFIWTAQHIRQNPINFYDFDVNWYGNKMRASEVIKNPPIASYYIALVTSVVGWGEHGLHLAFLVPAIAAILGCYVLARYYCTRPALAALGVLFTPAFLVSSSTIMCDTMMLAFWVWALVFWQKGIHSDRFGFLLLAGLLAGICALTKYFGVCLLPLMLVDGILKKRTIGLWVAALFVPVAFVGGYEWHSRVLYGHGLFFDAAGYATEFGRSNLLIYALIGLAFTGGCILTPICYSHLIYNRWTIGAGLVAGTVLAFLLVKAPPLRLTREISSDNLSLAATQLAAFAIVGVGALSLCAIDLWQKRDANSVVLFLWVVGTFVFAAFLNWTTNARSVLPMVPAVSFLLMRRIDSRFGPASRHFEPRLFWLLLPAAAAAFFVTHADAWLANSARSAAYLLHEKTKKDFAKVWFEGHWGFQYYMELLGATPLDMKSSMLYTGEQLVVPSNSPNVASFSKDVSLQTVLQTTPRTFVTTMDRAVGAGFYASAWGPLPFAFGQPRPERYELFTVTRGIRFVPSKHRKPTGERE